VVTSSLLHLAARFLLTADIGQHERNAL